MPSATDNVVTDNLERKTLYGTILGVSLLLSLLHVLTRPALNSDAAVFLMSAQIYLEQGYGALSATYDQPLFPLLIAWLSQLLHCETRFAADLIVATGMALTGCGFVALQRQLSGQRAATLAAAFVILTFPFFNNVRDDIYRDSCFWAAVLWSLYMLVRYERSASIPALVAALLLQLLAFGFRKDGAVFLLATPLVLVVQALHGGAVRLHYRLVITLGCAIALLFFLFSPLGELLQQSLTELYHTSLQQAHLLADSALNKHSAKYALGFYVSGLIYILLTVTNNALSIYSLVLLFILIRDRKLTLPRTIAYRSYLLLAILPLAFQLLREQFLQARYAVLLAQLILLAILHSGIQYTHFRSRGNRIVIACVLIWCLGDSVASLLSSRQYLTETAQWVEHNLPAQAKIISNQRSLSVTINHYADPADFLEDNPDWTLVRQKYDYFILISKQGSAPPAALNQATLIKQFDSSKKSCARIYRLNAQPLASIPSEGTTE